MEPITVSRADAVKLTGICRASLDKLIAAGAVKTTLIGRRRLIFRDSLIEMLEKGVVL